MPLLAVILSNQKLRPRAPAILMMLHGRNQLPKAITYGLTGQIAKKNFFCRYMDLRTGLGAAAPLLLERMVLQ